MTGPLPTALGAPADGQIQPAPVATPPAQPAATPPGAGQPVPTQPPATPNPGQPPAAPTPQGGQPPAAGQPAADAPLNLTQTQLDQIIGDRLTRAQQSWDTRQAEQNKALAAALGITDPNATPDPAKLVADAQAAATAAQTRADTADARSLALAAGVKADRVDLFLRLVDVGGALKDVDRSKGDAITGALTTAVTTALTAAPEFKGTTVPPASGGDRSGGQPAQGRIYTRDELSKMSPDQLVAINDDLQKAAAEGRIQ